MLLEKQILKILKEEKKPLKAKEIARNFMLYFNKSVTKKEINKTIHKYLKSEVISSGFPNYKYSLIKLIASFRQSFLIYSCFHLLTTFLPSFLSACIKNCLKEFLSSKYFL